MHPVLHLTRLFAGLFILIALARIEGSSLPSIATCHPQNSGRHAREIEAEVAHWSAQLKSPDAEERRQAVLVLSRLDGDSATSALVSALTDKSPAVRALVLAGLGERSDNRIVTLIAARLSSDKDAFVRKAAAYALGTFRGGERTETLIAALRDKDQEVRGAAAVSLGDHAEVLAIAPLVVSLSDKNAFVRAQAARALGVNGPAASQAVPTLLSLLEKDPDAEVKRQAATALGLIGDSSALPVLQRASQDADYYLAQAARDSIKIIERK
jgi:HEAT repeat protein